MVRTDLPRGLQAAQLIHAAGYSSPGQLPAGTYAVALAARDELELHRLSRDLARAGLPHHLVIEQDAPYTGQAVALGIAPMDRAPLRPLLRRFPLLT